jgi:hypothetical protein
LASAAVVLDDGLLGGLAAGALGVAEVEARGAAASSVAPLHPVTVTSPTRTRQSSSGNGRRAVMTPLCRPAGQAP